MAATTIGTPGAQANSTALRYIQESNWGVLEPGNPKLKIARYTGESLKMEPETVRSNEIEGSRQLLSVIRTAVRGAGGFNSEFFFGTQQDDLLQAILYSTDWTNTKNETTVISASSAITFDETAGVYTLTLGSGTWTNTPPVGSWIEIAGAGTAGNNGFARVAASTSTVITVTHKVLVDEAAGASVTITYGSTIANGSTFRSFSIEKAFTNLSNEFLRYRGMTPATMELSVAAKQICTVGWTFVGKDEDAATSTFGDGSPTAADSALSMDAVADVTGVFSNGSQLSSITGFDLRIDNNLRERAAVGVFGAESIGLGEFSLSGSIRAYYASGAALQTAYHDFTARSFAMIFDDQDAGAGTYIFDIGATRLTDAQALSTAKNTDVEQSISFEALRGGLGVTLSIHRFAN